ncbi:MAG: hypothetical protein MZV64_49660 [Ignavibacteriales bacterium]|nr:hypothetical protein [Ignavibacteriales bacterium]
MALRHPSGHRPGPRQPEDRDRGGGPGLPLRRPRQAPRPLPDEGHGPGRRPDRGGHRRRREDPHLRRLRRRRHPVDGHAGQGPDDARGQGRTTSSRSA